jgi:hypothetical protein
MEALQVYELLSTRHQLDIFVSKDIVNKRHGGDCMFLSSIVIKTHPVFLRRVTNKLNEFEGIVYEILPIPEKSVIVARIMTDNHKRFRQFLTQQVLPIQGIDEIEEDNWPSEHWSGNFGHLQDLRGNILQASALVDIEVGL